MSILFDVMGIASSSCERGKPGLPTNPYCDDDCELSAMRLTWGSRVGDEGENGDAPRNSLVSGFEDDRGVCDAKVKDDSGVKADEMSE